MTINDELIQRAERWLFWYRIRCALGEIDGSYHEGVALLRECVAALRAETLAVFPPPGVPLQPTSGAHSVISLMEDTPASTQRNPSPIDLPAPGWLIHFASPLEGQEAER